MTVRPTFRNFFILIIILSYTVLSATSVLPASMHPPQQEDFSDINPTYEWGIYLSGDSKYNYMNQSGMAADSLGNLYVLSLGQEDTDGVFTGEEPNQLTLHKVTKDGNLEWQFSFEINENSDAYPGSITVDGNDNIFVSGYTDDLSSPYYTDGTNNLFVAKFDPSGTLLWNTLVEIPDPFLATLSTDAEGNVYICGEGEVKAYDGISKIANFMLAKVSSQGSVEWVKPYGNFEYNDFFTQAGFVSKVGPNGFLYVIGDVNSSWGEPLQSFLGERDIFVAKFDRDGSVIWNTFLGTNGTYLDNTMLNDHPTFRDMEIDINGNIYVVGENEASWGNPITPFSGTTDSYLAKIDDNGNLLWNTFFATANGTFGGEGTSEMQLIDDRIYVFGESSSSWGNPIQPFNIRRQDDYIAQFDPNGALVWNSFFDTPSNKLILLSDEKTLYVHERSRRLLPETTRVSGIDSDEDNDDLIVAKINLYGTSTTYRPPSLYVPDITLHIPTPLDVSKDPGVIGTNVFLAVFLMLPFAIAVDVFSKIFSANEEYFNKFALIAWIGRAQKWFRDLTTNRASQQGLRDVVGLLGVIGFYGLVFSLLDVKWNPFSVSGIVLFVSMAVAFGLVGLLDDIIQWRAIRKWGHQGEFTVRPANLFLAAASTTVSRLLALAPGLMFGSPEALKINEEELSQTQNHALARISMFTYVVIGLTAWLPTIATYLLQQSDIAVNLKNIIGVVEAFLLVIFAVALENVFVQLIGFSDGLGQKIRSWNKLIWGISLTFASFAFLHTLLNPRYEFLESIQEGNIAVFIGVTASFILLTLFLHLYMRRRNRVAVSAAKVN
jgi:hypothetical protein